MVTVVVESRGLESHENRLIQSHPSDVGRVNVGGSESTGSWRWSVGRRFGEALVAAVGRVNVGGSESTGSWRWSVGRRFGEALVAVAGRVNVGWSWWVSPSIKCSTKTPETVKLIIKMLR